MSSQASASHVQPQPIQYLDRDGEDGSRFGYLCPPLSDDLREQFDNEAHIPAQVQAAALARSSSASSPSSSASASLRQTFVPITSPVKSNSPADQISRSESKFGGNPYLFAGEENGLQCVCGKTMSFMFQLSGQSLPWTLHGVFIREPLKRVEVSMFQCWVCLLCLQKNLGPEPGTWTCRWIDASAPSVTSTFTSQQVDRIRGVIPIVRGGLERRLTGWTSQQDLPELSEAKEVWGIEAGREWEEQDQPEPYPLPVSIEKLSGFPHWGNDVNYTDCSVCGERRELFLQFHFDPVGGNEDIFESEAMIGWGLIQVCPNHRNDLALVSSWV